MLVATNARAQITIDDNDMPSPGDTIRVSIGDILQPVDIVSTGAGQTWDFSALQFVSQTIDTFLSIGQTPGTYQLIFANVAFNPNRANVAAKVNLPIPPVGGITISDPYGFYYNSTASYKQAGFGANLNGIDTPVPYDNKDIIHNFPLNFNDIDSCDSDLSLSIPGLGYYGLTQHRVNECDGWGTLITPLGTFDVLRVKSTIFAHDTVYIDNPGIGFGLDRPLAWEYKWIGNGKSIPLLQINTTDNFGTENVTGIRYQDSIRTPLAVNEIDAVNSFSIYPNPAEDNFSVSLSSSKAMNVTLKIFNSEGKESVDLIRQNIAAGINTFNFSNDKLHLKSGVYLLQAMIDGNYYYRKLVLEK